MLKTAILALALTASTAHAVFQGFNSGAAFTDGSAKQQADFEKEFTTAKALAGTNGAFTSVRLFTTIQGGTQNTPTSAIPAALKEDVTMLLGLWASGGDVIVDNEIAALKSALSTYGDNFVSHIAGISVGSEDLYRFSPLGVAAKAGVGVGPDVISGYVKKLRDALKDTKLSQVPIGHVDTWTAWVDPTTKPVIDGLDWVGMDAYPYFESTHPNAIDNGKTLFYEALANTKGAAGSKPVWVTESGWPVAGPTSGAAIPSVQNAAKYWKDVACSLFGNTNTWWFILQDAKPSPPEGPTFGLVGADLNAKPYYDLSCSGASSGSGNTKSSSASSPAPSSGSGSSSNGQSGSADSSTGVTPDNGSNPGGDDTGKGSDSSSSSSTGSGSSGSSSTGSGSGSSSGSSSGSGSGSSSPTGLVPSVVANSTSTFASSAPTASATVPHANNAAVATNLYASGFVGAAVALVMAAL